MKITKKNGHEAMYDDEKVISSILKANEGTSEKTLTRTIAASIAADVFSRLTAENTIITTAEVRECVDLILREWILSCGREGFAKRQSAIQNTKNHDKAKKSRKVPGFSLSFPLSLTRPSALSLRFLSARRSRSRPRDSQGAGRAGSAEHPAVCLPPEGAPRESPRRRGLQSCRP